MSPSASRWKLYAVEVILEGTEHDQGRVRADLRWDEAWRDPQGVAIVGLAPAPATAVGTEPTTFCLRNEDGDVFPMPTAEVVEVTWQPFAPIPVTQPHATSAMRWPTNAEYALLLLLFRSPADMRYAPVLSLKKSTKQDLGTFSKTTWDLVSSLAESPAAIMPTDAEVREAVAYEMRSRPITRARYSVLDLP